MPIINLAKEKGMQAICLDALAFFPTLKRRK
jgi:hypothetical protein